METGYKKTLRKCHDCGKPTPDYRCKECWLKKQRFYPPSKDELYFNVPARGKLRSLSPRAE